MSKVVDYFLKYVAFDTQSAEDAGTVPSTEKQFALAKLLSEQLKNIGVKDVSMSEHGYVYGTIPANGDYNCQTVGFLAHMDTSPDCPDENVRPQLVKHYDGKDITLNKALGVKMTTKMFPFLKNYVGQDLITTDGTTLLGADDKAGIAEIMTMAETLLTHPEIPHGTIKIAFTPDEEVGHGGAASIPEGVTEVISVDMGCVGDGLSCKETQVSICAKDSRGPYNYDVVTGLIKAAKDNDLDFAVDVYPYYGSDADVALTAGYDVRHGLIGAGVYASHGYERSHKDGVKNTFELLRAYLG